VNLPRSVTAPLKRQHFHEVRLHLLAERRSGRLPIPSLCWFREARAHDLTAFKEQSPSVPTSVLFADKAYADEALKLDLARQEVTLLTPYKKKKNEPPQFNEPLRSRFVSSFKQPIESFFKRLNEKTTYQDASRVRSTNGLLVHCYGKLAFAGLLLCFYS